MELHLYVAREFRSWAHFCSVEPEVEDFVYVYLFVSVLIRCVVPVITTWSFFETI